MPMVLNAQEIITTSGGSISDSKTQVNWTIGEPITEVFSARTRIYSSLQEYIPAFAAIYFNTA